MMLPLIWMLLGAGDPRPELIELQLAGRNRVALVRVDAAQAFDPETARRRGFDYLRGHLLEQVGRDPEAPAAFAAAMTSEPTLAGYSRFRLALGQERRGHPEVAAGLFATLLANRPPRPLVPPAVEMLASSLTRGGDCRLLKGLDAWRLPDRELRRLELARARCALAVQDADAAAAALLSLLRESRQDEPARGAAEMLARAGPARATAETSLLVGLTFFEHREFRRAVPYLERSLTAADDIGGEIPGTDRDEIRYALARSFFWLGDYVGAGDRFARIAAATSRSSRAARALYQRARCMELDGDWASAAEVFREAFRADRSGDWAAPALLAAMRLDWRRGHEGAALEALGELSAKRSWRSFAERAALFAISSDIVRGRSDRAETWLRSARRARSGASPEIDFWQGRLEELGGRAERAVASYLAALLEDPHHPLAHAAGDRLRRPPLAAIAGAAGERLAASSRGRDLYAAWLLLDDAHPRRREVWSQLLGRLASSRRTRTYLEMRPIPPSAWPIWRRSPRDAEELLLTLGIIERISPAVTTHFPLADADAALTAGRLLAHNGHFRQSLRAVEVVGARLPSELPFQMLPTAFRRLLYPRPYRELVLRQASRFGVDPELLTAIIREESRFDPDVVSSASARGLTQFVLPTARRLAAKLGWPDLRAAELHQPGIAITLGAAYLAELARRFDNQDHVVVAAYNAGEHQALLWLSYCFSREPEEFFTKVGFSQTRSYLQKVLTSRAHYREIYPLGERWAVENHSAP